MSQAQKGVEAIRAQVEDLKRRLDRVIPALEEALAADPNDDRAWDAVYWAADLNEGGDLRMAIVGLRYELRSPKGAP